MTLKLGTLLLLSASAVAMSAQTPTTVQDIYSQSGVVTVQGDNTVVYNFGNWHAGETDGEGSFLSPLFEEMLAQTDNTVGLGTVFADADGIQVGWNSVEKLITVQCEAEMLGRTQVLISDLNGMNRGMVTVDDNPALISISNYVSGTYLVAVAVDGKLIKTFKIIL